MTTSTGPHPAFTATDLPRPTTEALLAHRALASDLSQWAPTVHELARERIAALRAAYGRHEHPLETAGEHAERVLAGGQYPFPEGECLYDDLNNNVAYEHVRVGYGRPEDGGIEIRFSGWYPRWAPDGQSYERRKAEIHCPGWLVAQPDGPDRYRRQTDEMAKAVRRDVEAEDARISALLDASCCEADHRDTSEGA